ncbi:hypothetical protein RI367_005859 [Sorochytrium milnesiophthora]
MMSTEAMVAGVYSLGAQGDYEKYQRAKAKDGRLRARIGRSMTRVNNAVLSAVKDAVKSSERRWSNSTSSETKSRSSSVSSSNSSSYRHRSKSSSSAAESRMLAVVANVPFGLAAAPPLPPMPSHFALSLDRTQSQPSAVARHLSPVSDIFPTDRTSPLPATTLASANDIRLPTLGRRPLGRVRSLSVCSQAHFERQRPTLQSPTSPTSSTSSTTRASPRLPLPTGTEGTGELNINFDLLQLEQRMQQAVVDEAVLMDQLRHRRRYPPTSASLDYAPLSMSLQEQEADMKRYMESLLLWLDEDNRSDTMSQPPSRSQSPAPAPGAPQKPSSKAAAPLPPLPAAYGQCIPTDINVALERRMRRQSLTTSGR